MTLPWPSPLRKRADPEDLGRLTSHPTSPYASAPSEGVLSTAHRDASEVRMKAPRCWVVRPFAVPVPQHLNEMEFVHDKWPIFYREHSALAATTLE